MAKKEMSEKVVAVTGAAGVLCRALVEDFLRHGARVALIGRHRTNLAALAKRM